MSHSSKLNPSRASTKFCLYALKIKGGKLSRKDLIKETGLANSTVDRAIQSLAVRGEILKHDLQIPGKGISVLYEVVS